MSTGSTEGTMTSATLVALVQRGVARQIPGVVDSNAPKREQLLALLEAKGAGTVVALGRSLRSLPEHPVLEAIGRGDTPQEVIDRWIRLERFGHTHNRTERLTRPDPSPWVVPLRHFAIDGSPTHPVDDLFVWGLLVALLERAGFGRVHAAVDGPAGVLVDDGVVRLGHAIPEGSERVVLRAQPRGAAEDTRVDADDDPPPADEASAIARVLPRFVAADPMRAWRVADAARTLALSSRQLQRLLQRQGTSFSEVVARARADLARAMMADPSLSLTEIAFCTGFADLAHLSRVFRRFHDVPPSALRAMLQRS